jgi:hypothetical protein
MPPKEELGRNIQTGARQPPQWHVILSLRMIGGNWRRVTGGRERKNGKVSFKCLSPNPRWPPRGFQFEIE